ncbi:MAG: alpha-L-arabinofuranosidase C-terminal domain-containing protein [Nitrososphaerota archaeon]|nr:alpha-N-arabinofuranosidase [Candidatus Bathyarchaeota archaeon]MDW8048574.1 alpha-L-arabinofuranosidase C-terminal domain-containing protein [Nitrososphaerota archaeon]
MNQKIVDVSIRLDDYVGLINPNLYGHFIEHLGRCIYPGIWVGEDSSIPNINGIRKDVIDALRAIRAPVFRWPGGCFADMYHWEDGIGPRENRPRRRNLWWGGEESNEFGTDEFIMFCRSVGAEPYICLNVGTGSPQEAFNWVEYCNFTGRTFYTELRARNGHPEPYNVKYWAVGNESWACGGSFDPTYYAWEYKRFANFLKVADPSINLIACGRLNIQWMTTFLECLRDRLNLVDGVAIHYYFSGRRNPFGGDVEFTDEEYYNLLFDVQNMEFFIQQTSRAINLVGEKRIGIVVDEWGTWYPQATHKVGLFQQNTLRDAILAGLVLNLFNRYSSIIDMANLAQTVNVLQSLIHTEGHKITLTPTYHLFDIYKEHMGNYALNANVDSPIICHPTQKMVEKSPSGALKPLRAVDASASLDREKKKIVVTLVNQSLDEDFEVRIKVIEGKTIKAAKIYILGSADVRDYNGFEFPYKVKPRSSYEEISGDTLTYTAPRHSISGLILDLA